MMTCGIRDTVTKEVTLKMPIYPAQVLLTALGGVCGVGDAAESLRNLYDILERAGIQELGEVPAFSLDHLPGEDQ